MLGTIVLVAAAVGGTVAFALNYDVWTSKAVLAKQSGAITRGSSAYSISITWAKAMSASLFNDSVQFWKRIANHTQLQPRQSPCRLRQAGLDFIERCHRAAAADPDEMNFTALAR